MSDTTGLFLTCAATFIVGYFMDPVVRGLIGRLFSWRS